MAKKKKAEETQDTERAYGKLHVRSRRGQSMVFEDKMNADGHTSYTFVGSFESSEKALAFVHRHNPDQP